MRSYVLRRLLYAALVVWAAYTVTFVLLWALPSDAVSLIAQSSGDSSGLSDEQQQALREQYGYDQPVLLQYASMLFAAIGGDLGQSIVYSKPVTTLFAENIGQTAELSVSSLLVGLAIGIPLAIGITVADARPWGKLLDAIPSFVLSVPGFVLALVLIQVFSFGLRLLPPFGGGTFRTLVLPTLAIAIPLAAFYAQVLSQGLRTSLRQPYVDVLRAKGVSSAGILFRHALHNAGLPFLTMLGFSVGSIFVGSVVVETVFSRPGVGRLLQESVNQQDIPVVQGLVLIAAVSFALANLAVDLLYPLVDRRVLSPAALPQGAPA